MSKELFDFLVSNKDNEKEMVRDKYGFWHVADERIMYNSVYELLIKKFPAEENWVISQKFKSGEIFADFIVKREKNGKIELVVVEIKNTNKIKNETITRLNVVADMISKSDKNIEIVRKILFVPEGADTSLGHKDIELVKV